MISAHIQAFSEEIVRRGRVFTLTDKGQYLLVNQGDLDVIPCWSSRNKVELIQAVVEDCRDSQVSEVSLSEFFNWLPEIQDQEILIAANWSGKTHEADQISARRLRKILELMMKGDARSQEPKKED